MFIYVYVDDVRVPELPCQCDVVGTFGGGSEYIFTGFKILEHLDSLLRVDVLKLRVVYPSRLVSTLTLCLIVHLESGINQIFWVINFILNHIVLM